MEVVRETGSPIPEFDPPYLRVWSHRGDATLGLLASDRNTPVLTRDNIVGIKPIVTALAVTVQVTVLRLDRVP